MIRCALFAVSLLALGALAGCGGSTSVSPDEEQLLALVLDVSDATGDPQRFAAIFTPGSTADLKKFAGLSFGAMGLPDISGETASVQVRVKDKDDTKLGETTWLAIKEGGTWKISSAPLP